MQAAAGGGEEEEAGEEARLFFEDRSGDANAGKVRIYHPPSGTSLGPELSVVVISWEADTSSLLSLQVQAGPCALS